MHSGPVIKPFQDPLPIPKVLDPVSIGADGTCYYRVTMRAGSRRIHKCLPAETPFWGYEGSYPGPTIEVQRDIRVVVEFSNELTATPETLWPFAYPKPAGHVFIPPAPWTVVHLHGSPSPPDSDGWADNAYFPGGSQTHHYPPQESAALLWYHDHANMVTRLNVYSGLAGFYIVRDPAAEGKLKLPVGEEQGELPLLLQDRNLEIVNDTFTGRFAYPDLAGISQFLGRFRLVNGVIWPFKKVQRKPYRLRILNGSNGRFFRLQIQPDGGSATTQGLTVIGVDGGFLPRPVSNPITTTSGDPEEVLTLAPAERVDVLIDFSRYPPNSSVTLVDEIFGDTVEVTRFDIEGSGRDPQAPTPAPAAPPVALDEFQSPRAPRPGATSVAPALVRPIGLYQVEKSGMKMNTINGREFHEAVEEKPELDTEEEWLFLNLIAEDHPMHLHLVNFQVINRRRIKITAPNPAQYRKAFDAVFQPWRAMNPATRPPLPAGLEYDGDPIPADAYEVSPKDTVRAPSDMVTRIRVRFRLRTGLYMYHCHILEHEDMEMMRPLLVVPRGAHTVGGSPGHHGHG